MNCQNQDDRGGTARGGSALDWTNIGSPVVVGTFHRLSRLQDGTQARTVLQTPHGDSRNTSVITCSLGMRVLEQGAAGARWDGLAVLSFGVGGALQTAEIDWRNGCHIAVPASFLEVAARYALADASQVDAVELRAGAAWGSEPSRNICTRSFGPIAVPPGVSATFPVPPFAVAAQVGGPGVPLPVTFAFQQLADPAATIIIDQATGPELIAAKLTDGVHLHGSARFWRLANTGAVPVTCWPWFTIGL